MSVVGEIVGVIACVAGIMSAYHDGSAVIQKIKLKRAQKKAAPPPRLLEESIDQAPQEIEREKQRGVARFGRVFEEGDHIAVIALQQITIQLQASLLEKLRNAAFDDDQQITDFTFLIDASDLGRDRTIATMLEFRQRLLEAKPIVELQPPTPRSSGASLSKNVLQSICETSSPQQAASPRQLPSPSGRQYRTWTREYGPPAITAGDEDKDTSPGADDHGVGTQRKRTSFLHFLKHHHRGHSPTEPKSPSGTSSPPETTSRQSSITPTSVPFRPPLKCDISEPVGTAGPVQPATSRPEQPQSQHSPQSQQSQQPEQPRFTYQDWEDDPALIWGSKPNLDRRETVSIAPDAVQPPQQLQPGPMQRINSSSSIPTPTPENEYLGFCKGAWKLYNGDRKGAFSKQREVNAYSRHPSGNVGCYLACSHGRCAFRSHTNIDVIWTKAWTVHSKGLKFRWAFLAKSHVTQRVVVKNQYTFQCMFCTFLGDKGRLYHGIDHYLEHVSADHRGQRMGELVLYKTNCINDRVAGEDDEFEVNLWPLSAEELQQRQEHRKSDSVVNNLADAFLNKNTDAADSMFGDEPWNEGLSDFKYHSEHDRVEFA